MGSSIGGRGTAKYRETTLCDEGDRTSGANRGAASASVAMTTAAPVIPSPDAKSPASLQCSSPSRRANPRPETRSQLLGYRCHSVRREAGDILCKHPEYETEQPTRCFQRSLQEYP